MVKRTIGEQPEEKETFPLELLLTSGHNVEIISPINSEQFHEELQKTIGSQKSNPNWTGWYQFRKKDGKIVSLNVMHIIAIITV
jgi:hypothetical protein